MEYRQGRLRMVNTISLEDFYQQLKKGEGYDALLDDFGNMQAKGIIDPLKVTRAALENAVSIAGLVLTTNCLVTDLPEKEKALPPMPGGGMPDMGGF